MKGWKLSVLVVYTPNEDAEVEEKKQYLESLDDTMTHIGIGEELLMLKYVNAWVGMKIESINDIFERSTKFFISKIKICP